MSCSKAIRSTRAVKRATNISLKAAILTEARSLGINISRACENGLAQQIAEERSRRWLRENRAAIESSNDYVEKHGLALARFRQF